LGVGDPIRRNARASTDGRAWRGWAALLADGLRDPELHILASNGACVADIEHDQLPRALAVEPEIASVVFGINDTLRPSFDPEHIAAATARIVGTLRASGAQVLTMRLPDAGKMLRLPSALARPLARRTQAVNAALDAAAERFGTLHFDAAGTIAAYDKKMWAVDRLHPNERGHRLIARSFHSLLADVGHPVEAAPAAEPSNPPPGKLAEIAWMATKGTAWVIRRSTDMVPYLLAMAARELLGTDGQSRAEPAEMGVRDLADDRDLGRGHDQDPVAA
jgi:lysophospholipase L1-like esterase